MTERNASSVTLADVGKFIDEWVRGMGGVPESERPYLGNRCGWYPEKPKRRRRH